MPRPRKEDVPHTEPAVAPVLPGPGNKDGSVPLGAVPKEPPPPKPLFSVVVTLFDNGSINVGSYNAEARPEPLHKDAGANAVFVKAVLVTAVTRMG